MNRILIFAVSLAVFCSGMIVDSIDFNATAPIVLSTAHAYYHGQGRRVARRTARRTARRVSARHNYYAPRPVVYGAGAVAATAVTAAAAVAIGTRVAALPGGCRNIVVNGATYYNCNGAYYQPMYDGPNLVYVVVPQP